MIEVTQLHSLPSLCPAPDRQEQLITVGAVQHCFNPNPNALRAELAEGIERAASHGAKIVFLPELTLSKYPADAKPNSDRPVEDAEDLLTGPTFTFAAEQAARHDVVVHASLYQKQDSDDGRGLNTAIMVSPQGQLLGATDKLHIPVTEGYFEDHYFRPGTDVANPYPVHVAAEINVGLPTCWDEWFPELARSYSLAGAGLLAYPTAIGSEPDYPHFDTQPLWQHVIVGNGIANALFMVVPNRWGDEGRITFYGSSFISDPFGRVLVQAPRDESAVLVAELDLAQRTDWQRLFPFENTRRPDTYASLTAPVSALAGSFIAGQVC